MVTMPTKTYQQQLRGELTQAILDVCRSKLPYSLRFSIEGLLGITLEDGEVFLVNLNQGAMTSSDLEEDAQVTGCSDYMEGKMQGTSETAQGFGQRQFVAGDANSSTSTLTTLVPPSKRQKTMSGDLGSLQDNTGFNKPNVTMALAQKLARRKTGDGSPIPEFVGPGRTRRRGCGQKDRNHEAFWEEFEAVYLACKQAAEHPNWSVPQIMWHVQSVHKLGEHISVSRFQHYLSRFVFNILDCRMYLRNPVTGQADRVCVSEAELVHLIRETHRSNHASWKNIYEILRARYYPCNIKKFHDIYTNQVLPDCDSCSLRPRGEGSPKPRKNYPSQVTSQVPSTAPPPTEPQMMLGASRQSTSTSLQPVTSEQQPPLLVTHQPIMNPHLPTQPSLLASTVGPPLTHPHAALFM